MDYGYSSLHRHHSMAKDAPKQLPTGVSDAGYGSGRRSGPYARVATDS